MPNQNENPNPATAPEPENYGLPENFVPIDVPPIIPANLVPGAGPAVNPYKSGTLNPNLSFQQDLVNAGSYGPGVPSTRLMPIGAAGNPQANAAIKSVSTQVATEIVTNAIAAIPPTTPVSDGLDHGTSPWETDPTNVILTDDFASGNTTADTIGALGWAVSGGTGAAFETGFPPHIGSISWQTSTVANEGGALYLYNGNTTYGSAMPLLDYPGWKLSWVWRWARKTDSASTSEPSSFSECAFYAGLQMSDDFGSGTRSPIFIGAQFDTDVLNSSNGTRAIADSTIKLAAFVNPYVGSGRNNALAIPVLQSRAGSAGAGATAVVNGFLPYIITSSLVVCISWIGSETISSVADNLGNTYTLAETVSNGTAINTAIYYATNLQSCTTLPAITVTFSSSTTGCVSVYELGGTIILDQTSSGAGNSTSASTGTVTNTSTCEVGICSVGSVIDSLPTAGTGWLMDKTADTTAFGHGEETIQTNQNTSVQGLATVGSGNWAIALATFKASVINLHDTGMTPTEGTWYRLDMSCVKAGQITLSLSANGVTKSTTFNVPQYVAGSIENNGGAGTVVAGNGQAELALTSTSVGEFDPWITGSQITVAGLVGTPAVLNGPQTVYETSTTSGLDVIWIQSAATVTTTNIGFTVAGYPALFPAVQWGCDSTATPPNNYYAAQIDFFGFVWSSGLAASPLGINSAYSRYWTGS